MEPSSSPASAPIKQLYHSLPGRIRAMKVPSDSGSYTDSGSELATTRHAQRSSLAGLSGESSFDDSDNGTHQGRESESDTSGQAPQNEATSVSFGALVKAQASIGNQKPSNLADGSADGHGSHSKTQNPRNFANKEALERRAGKRDTRDFLRTSKHAPAEISSKRAVSRKREVVPTQKSIHRDPRFEPLYGAVDEKRTKKDYSFLDAYRDSEMLHLKLAIRKIKDGEGKEKLKRALLSMESRKKAQKMKEQQQEILRKHRKEEKEKIEQGKRPFYLKKADQKKKALIERFEGMKSTQVDKTIERRRKKKAAKERKGMPSTRRGQL